MIDVAKVFEAHDDEFLKGPIDGRPDVRAFTLLDRLVPGTRDMVASAEHDRIWLDVDLEKLAAVATVDDIIVLIQCGVLYDDEEDSLYMFV
jgi:hypothetical protein